MSEIKEYLSPEEVRAMVFICHKRQIEELEDDYPPDDLDKGGDNINKNIVERLNTLQYYETQYQRIMSFVTDKKKK